MPLQCGTEIEQPGYSLVSSKTRQQQHYLKKDEDELMLNK